MELNQVVSNAVEAALGAGAEAAEAYAEDSTKREVRVFGGEVESLTDAGERGVGVRAWIGGRVGYAYATDLSDDGLRRLGADAAEAARIADPDEFAAPPETNGAVPEIEGLADPSVDEWTTERKVELAKRIEAVARAADERIEAVETAVYVDEDARAALASSTGLAGAYEATACYAYLQAIAAAGGDRQTGLGFGMGRGPEDLDAEAIGREAADRAVSLLGASKPTSRSCPVVFD
ncbi:MAG TPA: DNA gyrase modulator, partial [Acidimicrobiia bacterium]|nr:DNA gyrase modulator [Acidimicrobiia bacterium]